MTAQSGTPRLMLRILAALVFIAGCLIGFLYFLNSGPSTYHAMARDAIGVRGGFAFQYFVPEQKSPIPGFRFAADSSASPQAATSQVLENGIPLGPAHSQHSIVSDTGAGAFSHWTDGGGREYLVFSTSDNSDARSNGNSYELRTVWTPTRTLTGAGVLLALLALVYLVFPYRSKILLGSGLAFAGIALVLAVQHAWAANPTAGPNRGVSGMHHRSFTQIGRVDERVWLQDSKEAALPYIRRLTETVHMSTYHCAADLYRLSLLEKIMLVVTGQDGLFQQGFLVAERFSCGLCHQRAFLLAEILRENGYAADVYGLQGHVVTRVTLPEGEYMTDPDYGVGPFRSSPDGAELEAITLDAYQYAIVEPAMIATLYASVGDNVPYDEHIFTIRDQQEAFFHASRITALILGFCGAAILGALAFTHRRRLTGQAPFIASTDAAGSPDAQPRAG